MASLHNYLVVAGFLSPSHDDYVHGKLYSDAIKGSHRAEMISLLTKESTWLDVSRWELNQKSFEDFPSVAMHHLEYVKQKIPDTKITVMYVCGTDHAIKCRLFNGINGSRGCVPVLAVARLGTADSLREAMKTRASATSSGNFYLVETEAQVAEVSSTLIRKRLAAKQSVADLTGPEVENYILQNKILGARGVVKIKGIA